jgi:hypothetical protein
VLSFYGFQAHKGLKTIFLCVSRCQNIAKYIIFAGGTGICVDAFCAFLPSKMPFDAFWETGNKLLN